MKLVNYKLFENHEIDEQNVRILIIAGPNEKGKTSIVTALQEAWSLKGFTPDPLKKGEEEGYTSVTGPDKDGNSITIIHNFNKFDQKGEFYAIDHLGRTIKSTSKIRELLGDFKAISLEEVFYMIQSAEGRRKFIKEYIYPVMGENIILKIDNLNAEINERNGSVFVQRKNASADLLSYTKIYESQKLKPEEESLILKQQDYVGAIKQLKETLKTEEAVENQAKIVALEKSNKQVQYLNATETRMRQNNRLKEIEEAVKKLLQEKEAVERERTTNDALIQKLYNEFEAIVVPTVNTPYIEELKINIQEGESELEKIKTFVAKKANIADLEEKIKVKQAEVAKLNESLSAKRQELKDVISTSELPAGLEIQEDEILLNGFNFSQSQVSESSAKLALAELFCKLYTARFITMGSLSAFGKDRLLALYKTAQEYNKIVVLEWVDETTEEIKVITEIEG